MEAQVLSRNFLFPLDEPCGNTTTIDLVNERAPMTLARSPAVVAVAGATGSTLQALGGYLPQGIGGPVVTFTNPVTGAPGSATYLEATDTVVGVPAGDWSPVIAFRVGTLPTSTNVAALWTIGYSSGQVYASTVDASGRVGWVDNNVLAGFQTDLAHVNDGGWHLLVLTSFATLYVDAVASSANPASPNMAGYTGAQVSERFGGAPINTLSNGILVGFNGDMALLAEIPAILTPAQVTQLYQTFRYGSGTGPVASSATRYQDILRWGGWAGLQAEDNFTTGETTAHGPATELLASADQTGTDVVSGLQTVVDTDNGSHYVAQDGTITFKARRARYNMTLGSPQATFGENTGAGEIPYTTNAFGLDPSRLANDAAITQTGAGIAVRFTDPTSIGTFGDIQLQRSVNTLNPLEVNDAANYRVQRNRTPKQRLERISVDVGSNPGAWATLLALELGEYVRVMRRPPNAPAIQFDGIVEQLNWTMHDQNGAHLDLMITPLGIGQNLSQLTASRAPLNASVLAGVTSIVVNVPTDAGGTRRSRPGGPRQRCRSSSSGTARAPKDSSCRR